MIFRVLNILEARFVVGNLTNGIFLFWHAVRRIRCIVQRLFDNLNVSVRYSHLLTATEHVSFFYFLSFILKYSEKICE